MATGAPSRYEAPSTGSLHGVFGPGAGSTRDPRMISPTEDPTFRALYEQIRGMIGGVGETPEIAALLSQGANSPLMQAIIQPALNYQRQQQGIQQRNLLDQFREAGTLGSGPMGAAMAELFRQQGETESSLIGQTMSSNLSPILSAMMNEYQMRFMPIEALTRELGLIRPEFYVPPTTTGGSRGGGGGGTFRGNISPLGATQWTPADMTAPSGGYAYPDSAGGASTPNWGPILDRILGSGGGGGAPGVEEFSGWY